LCKQEGVRSRLIRKIIGNLWIKDKIPQQNAVFLDAVAYIFKKMEDNFVNELSGNKHVLAYHKLKKSKITNLLNIAEKKDKSWQIEDDKTGKKFIDTDNEIIEIYKYILEEDKNNTTALYRLGLIYFGKNMISESLDYFSLLSQIILEYGDDMKDPLEKLMCFKTFYYLGLIYLHKFEAMLCDNKGKLSKEQQKEKEYYLNNAINKLEIASNGYNNNGMLYYFLGIAYSYNNNHQKAQENYNKALEYQPDIIIPK